MHRVRSNKENSASTNQPTSQDDSTDTPCSACELMVFQIHTTTFSKYCCVIIIVLSREFLQSFFSNQLEAHSHIGFLYKKHYYKACSILDTAVVPIISAYWPQYIFFIDCSIIFAYWLGINLTALFYYKMSQHSGMQLTGVKVVQIFEIRPWTGTQEYCPASLILC